MKPTPPTITTASSILATSGLERLVLSVVRPACLAVGASLAMVLGAAPAVALDFGSPLAYFEGFAGETAFPTTPEVDVMSGGGLVPLMPSGAPVTLTGTSAHIVATSSGFREGVFAEVDDSEYSTVESNVGLRTTYSNLFSASPGEAWLGNVLRMTRDDDLALGGTSVFALLQVREIAPGFGSVRILAGEERVGPNFVPDYLMFVETQVPLADANLLFANGDAFTFDLKLDRAAGTVVASVTIAGTPEVTTAVLPLVYAQNYSVSSAQQYVEHRGVNSDPFEVDLDSFQLYAEPHVFEPLFNIDVGSSLGTPLDTYAAAGSAGYWNSFVLGANTLLDIDGVSTASTASLSAASLDDAAVGGVDAPLLGDWAADPAGWAVTFSDLDPLGAYRVKVYTMAEGFAESGQLMANGEPHDTLPGESTPILVEGQSYAVIDTLVLDGILTVTSSPTLAGIPPDTHLAGLQIETTVPLPEPSFSLGLGLAFVLLIAGARAGNS